MHLAGVGADAVNLRQLAHAWATRRKGKRTEDECDHAGGCPPARAAFVPRLGLASDRLRLGAAGEDQPTCPFGFTAENTKGSGGVGELVLL
jgi:hypothetical protein